MRRSPTYPHAIHYALKANSTLALLRLLRSLGSRADANSWGEIEVAQRAGFAPKDIVFTGVGKTRDELEYGDRSGRRHDQRGVRRGARSHRVDCARRRAAWLAWRCASIPTSMRGVIRTSPPDSRSNKFGVPIQDARAIYAERRAPAEPRSSSACTSTSDRRSRPQSRSHARRARW